MHIVYNGPCALVDAPGSLIPIVTSSRVAGLA
jgi:hypothetical protein